jgi:phosphohistidine phosphatase
MGSAGEPRTRRLAVVRHAKSSWDDSSVADHDRPLAPRGRKALRRLRDHLEHLALHPGLVLCSSSRRTRETLDGIRSGLGHDVLIEIDRQLYGADVHAVLDRLRRVDDDVECVLLIGHNPGVADLVQLLLEPRGSAAPEAFPTAAVAVLSFHGSWRALEPARATLDSYWTPRHR